MCNGLMTVVLNHDYHQSTIYHLSIGCQPAKSSHKKIYRHHCCPVLSESTLLHKCSMSLNFDMVCPIHIILLTNEIYPEWTLLICLCGYSTMSCLVKIFQLTTMRTIIVQVVATTSSLFWLADVSSCSSSNKNSKNSRNQFKI